MHQFAYHNDRLLPVTEVRLSPGQAGLLSGWGIFTTLRIYDGRPFAFERHWKRLSRDACLLQLPFEFSPQAVRGSLKQVIETNKVSDGCARVYFIYNKVGIWTSDEPLPVTDLLIYTADRPLRAGPAQLTVEPNARHAASVLAGTKVTSWLQNVWTLERAHQLGFEEAVLLNERGEVAECTAANLFRARHGAVETPPLSSGCLAGITREVLLEIAPKCGIPISERTLPLEDLYGADEVFMSSTTREVQPVLQIGEYAIAQAPGPVTTRLARAFSDYVSAYFASQS